MVDWDRVEELRAKGRDWSEIAADPKVGFHPDASAGDPGRALRALYRRSGHRERAAHPSEAPTPAPRTSKEATEHRWTLTRLGYLLVPLVAVWFVIAYLVPSPVGLVVPAIPYLALALAVVAFVLIYALWRRTEGPRWSKVYRNTLVGGVALGLVVSGLIGLSGGVIFGCPYLPSSASVGSSYQGWSTIPTSAWKEGGLPVVFYYAGTWCPYCSASSWAVWKALTEFGSVSGNHTGYSFSYPEPYAYTPEMVLSNAHISSSTIALEVNEYDGSTDGQLSGAANCYQQAYITAYDMCSTCGVPFLVLNGQYMHVGSLYDPANLSQWNRTNNANGAQAVANSVSSETGAPWQTVQGQAWWIMAFLVRATGQPVPHLASQYSWSSTTTRSVWHDVNLTS